MKEFFSSYKKIYTDLQERSIKAEFKRLEDQCYLEHAGSTLYSEKQISNILSDLNDNLYANPHARSTSSKVTEDLVDQIRYEILRHFKTNVEEYSVIFTSGSTAALKLVGECFDYQDGCFAYLYDNHTSVLGMREYAPCIKAITHDEVNQLLEKNSGGGIKCDNSNSLFVYPAQSNFSGTKYPLSWVGNIHNGALNALNDVKSRNWFCFLDAAAFVSTNELDLSAYKPDFVCVSFYKIFGYPTGLGALLVKNSSAHVLKKKYYGGGTVFMALSLENLAVPRNVLHERYEDGTLPFLSITALRHGFETLRRLNLDMEIISKHTFLLAQYVYNSLSTMHHSNGNPVAILYHDTHFEDRRYQGGIVNFNLLRANGAFIGYAEVLNIANLFGVHLRTGCFCNPGSCQTHLKLSTSDVKRHFEKGHVCGDQNDLIDGYPTGSVRISFGYMSTKKDADDFLTMIADCFVTKPIVRKISTKDEEIKNRFHDKFLKMSINYKSAHHGYLQNRIDTNKNHLRSNVNDELSITSELSDNKIKGILEEVLVYPIKSCSPFSVPSSWKLVSTGLKYDREWMIVNASGVCLTQKQDTFLCRIKPYIDLKENVLKISFEGMPEITVSLTASDKNGHKVYPCQSKVCDDYVQAWDCGDDVSHWLSEALNRPGLRLLRQCTDMYQTRTKNKNGETLHLSLANQAQFLLINTCSVKWLFDCIPKNTISDTLEELIRRFRPNFVIDFGEPFLENELKQLLIGDAMFKSTGSCTRCQMICVDQKTGEKSVEPLRTLSKEFGGKISFGIYLMQESSANCNIIELKSFATGTSL